MLLFRIRGALSKGLFYFYKKEISASQAHGFINDKTDTL